MRAASGLGWAIRTGIALVIIGVAWIGDTVRADEGCPGAPRSLVAVGAAAVVAPGIDRLNLRILPARDTGIIAPLYAGNTLTILSQGSCNGGLTWWQVETASGRRGWVAEGTWTAYYLLPETLPADAAAIDPLTPLAWTLRGWLTGA